jgi:hypothetical protein
LSIFHAAWGFVITAFFCTAALGAHIAFSVAALHIAATSLSAASRTFHVWAGSLTVAAHTTLAGHMALFHPMIMPGAPHHTANYK